MKRIFILLLALGAALALSGCGNGARYQEAMDALEAGAYTDAIEILEDLGSYEDAEEQLQRARYAYGGSLLETGDYEGAAAAFTAVEGIYKPEAERSLAAIDCMDAAEEVTAILRQEYETPLPDGYLSLFALDFSYDFYYDVPAYTYCFTLYFPEGMSHIVSGLTFGEGSIASLAGGAESQGKEIEIYQMFRDRGFPGITVQVDFLEYDGTPVNSYSYSEADYEADLTAEAQKKEAAAEKAKEILANYPLLTNDELYLDAQGAADPGLEGRRVRMEGLQLVTKLENTDGSMDCDMALWVSTGIGGAIHLEITDDYAVERILAGAETLNVYGTLHIEPNEFHPELSSITLLDSGVYFTDVG